MEVIIKRSRGCYSEEAAVDVDIISSVHWGNVSGGVNVRHAGFALYGYIDYSLASKIVSCSGMHAHYGHSAKIMIPASLNKEAPYREGYEYLLECAGRKPSYHYRLPGQKPCTKRILELIAQKESVTRKALRDQLLSERYGGKQIARALNRMEKDGRIIYKEGSSNSQQQIIILSNTVL